jgi:hypothetical protein
VNYRTLKCGASADLITEANRLHPTPEGGDFRHQANIFRQPFLKRLLRSVMNFDSSRPFAKRLINRLSTKPTLSQ